MPSGTDEKGRFIRAAVRDDFFATREPNRLRLAGLIASDGCLSRGGRGWTLSQSGWEGRARLEYAAAMIGHAGRITSYQPRLGQRSYQLAVTSEQMVGDLRSIYRIAPAKTLTYKLPDLDAGELAHFLRGYVEGDGCVGEYPTRSGMPYLHISYVATPEFADAAIMVTPGRPRRRLIARCKTSLRCATTDAMLGILAHGCSAVPSMKVARSESTENTWHFSALGGGSKPRDERRRCAS